MATSKFGQLKLLDFPAGPVVKNLSSNTGDTGLIPGLGRSHMLWEARVPRALGPHCAACTPQRRPDAAKSNSQKNRAAINMCVPVFCVGVSLQLIWVNNCTMNTGQYGKPILGGVCLVTQSCLTLCDPTDCGPPGSSVHGILQARTLEGAAIPFSRGSSRAGDRTLVSCLAARVFTV